ncbi:MAG TPA: cyclopropane-fatty-acyl-phospholipid synthase family protein [Kineosporiaceae bacterium]|nr:cyclopropane-fatty-acyl-phospholipid synthase family protein [Kineosporiaceae bacterium]
MSVRDGENPIEGTAAAPAGPANAASGTNVAAGRAGAAVDLLSVLEAAVGGTLPVRIRCWDGSVAGDPGAAATLVFRDPRALRRMLWAPGELGLVRAYVAGDLDFEGDIFAALDLPDVIARIAHHHGVGLSPRERLHAVATARRLGALGPPPRPPVEEMRRRSGALHSKVRDSASVSHHYDVGNDFYRLVLGPSLVYSCAYWTSPPGPAYNLDDAQRDKLDLVCTKLGLRPGMRLLDVGCGWGSLAIHAAAHYGVSVVGVTVSREQAALARRRVEQAGLVDSVTIRLQDYRDVADGPYQAIASVGMSEHVGRSQLPAYAQALADLLAPGGRLLNHAIASVRSLPPPSKGRPGFIDSYIFPDGEVLPLSNTLDALEHAELEVRDVEALREHYGWTLRAWVDNLRDQWDTALTTVAASRARTWMLYLAACALAFDHGNLTVHQVVAIKQGDHGGIPRIRRDWVG